MIFMRINKLNNNKYETLIPQHILLEINLKY